MTHDPDHDLKHLLRQWQVTPPPADLEARLTSTALRAPQVTPLRRRLAREVEMTFTQWAYALPYKIAAAATCLLVGAGLGGLLEEPVNVAGLALMTLTGGAS